MSALSCPACATEMDNRLVRNVALDHCAECRGTWFDSGELARVLKLSVPTLLPRGSSKLACPHCASSLQLSRLGSMDVEWCPSCGGAFLGKGEVERLSDGRLELLPAAADGVFAVGVEAVIDLLFDALT